MTLLRHLLAVVLLPGTVTVVVPIWIARRNAITLEWPSDADGLAPLAVAQA